MTYITQGLSFITFICSVVYPRYAGDGFVDFVTMSAFLTILIDLILNILSLRGKLPNISNIVVSYKLALIRSVCYSDVCYSLYELLGYSYFSSLQFDIAQKYHPYIDIDMYYYYI